MKPDIRGFILLVIASIVLWFARPAQAVDFEATYGMAQWQRSDNGTWWETPFKEHWPASSDTWSIGYTDKFSDSIRWHIGYSNLGVVSSYGEAVGDDVYGATHGCTTSPCPAPDQWYGKGSVDGGYFTVAPEMTFHNITYSFEVGVWNYQPESIVYVPVQHPCGLCNPSPVKTDQYFITSSNRMWGQVFGVGVSYKNLFLRGRMYWVDSDDRDYPAVYQKYTSEISIGWRW